jgi:DNA-binding NarL/FixJ family response regulator
MVADDQARVRGGFRVLVDSAAGMQVVGEACDGAQAVEPAEREHPDVILMGIRMPTMDGLEATRRILAACRLPPAACRLPPAACRLPPAASRRCGC